MTQWEKVLATRPELDPWAPHGKRREEAFTGCPLTSTHDMAYMHLKKPIIIFKESCAG